MAKRRRGIFKRDRLNFSGSIILCLSSLMLLVAPSAMAQATTEQFASGVGTPQGGLVLAGSAINPATGKPFRHVWSADAVNGLCRLDPDVDTALPHTINPTTCLTSVVGGVAFNPGQLALDPATNTVYAIDAGGKLGIFMLHFLPDGDAGQGLFDTVNQSVLGGNGTAISGCGIATNRPNSAVLGPDGNLYVGFQHSGNIMRIVAPLTVPLPCTNVQPLIAQSPDLKITQQMAWAGHDLFANDSRGPFVVLNADQCFTPQNGFVACQASFTSIFSVQIISSTTVVGDQTPGLLDGNNLYFGMSNSVGKVANAENPVGMTITGNYGGTGFQLVSALALDVSDRANQVLYVGDDPSNGLVPGQGRWWQILPSPPPPGPPSAPVNVAATGGDAQATVSWNPPLNRQPVTSYTVHVSLSSNGTTIPDVIVTAPAGSNLVPTSAIVTGLTNGVSYQFEVLATNTLGSSAFSTASNSVTPQALTAPGVPTNVSATPNNASALVAWSAPANNGGSAITSYTITAYVGGIPTGITATVPGSSTGAAVNGLTNGTAYTFTVHATNAIGSSPESAASAPVTPAAVATTPGPPTGVAAVPGDAQASVFWFAPASDGGSPITSYAVTTYIGGAPAGVPVTVPGTSAVITGLTDGATYTFTVHATNAVGNGPESLPSSPIVPALPPPDLAINMTGPTSVVAGNSAVYSLTVSNLGPSSAPGVTVIDSQTGATISSASTTQGSCTIAATISCNLGTMAAGSSVSITVTLKPSTQTVNQASVQSSAGGDPNPANNTASVTTTFIPLSSTTDVQVVGAAQNGGPSVTSSDTFTWQIKNNQSLTANAVHFTSTLATGMAFQSAGNNMGTCSLPVAGTAGATLTCDLPSLPGGQTMIVTVTVTFNATGSMSTSGQATFSGTDNNPANNQASITIGVK